MKTRFAFALLLLGALSLAPVFADDVYLANGRSFKGVIATVTDSQVQIQMPGGQLSLPRSQVSRVVESDSGLAEYLRRKEALQRSPNARGADWLAFALWSRSQGMEHGAREAALTAAELDPYLQGLKPLMRGLGYVLDEELDKWIPYGDSMRRRGFVFSNGHWISREEHQRAQQEEEDRRLAARRAAEDARAARSVERLSQVAELALAREVLQPRQTDPYYPYYPYSYYPYGASLLVTPDFRPPVDPVRPGGGGMGPVKPTPHHRQPNVVPPRDSTFTRIPGSLIPGRLIPPVP